MSFIVCSVLDRHRFVITSFAFLPEYLSASLSFLPRLVAPSIITVNGSLLLTGLDVQFKLPSPKDPIKLVDIDGRINQQDSSIAALTSSISAETTRAIIAEAYATSQAADGVNQVKASVQSEVSRAITSESSLSTAINQCNAGVNGCQSTITTVRPLC